MAGEADLIIANRMSAAGRAGLAALTDAPEASLLALDYDGTLAPIVLDPAHARPQAGAREALAAAAEGFGRVAIVSGRPVASLVALLDLAAPDAPPLTVVGVHGREWWSQPRISCARPRPSDVPEGRGRARKTDEARVALAELLPTLPPGVRIEDKGHSLGVHFRGCSDPSGAAAQSEAAVRAVAARCRLEILPGRLVLELLEPGPDKGVVLRELAAGARAVCFLGDDLADLAAFAAIDQLRAVGVPGLKIAVANAESPGVAGAADLILESPAAVVEFVSGLAGCASRGC